MTLNIQETMNSRFESPALDTSMTPSRMPAPFTTEKSTCASESPSIFGYRIDPNRLQINAKRSLTICVANTLHRRLQAYRLSSNVYKRMGYTQPDAPELQYGPHDALANTITFLAHRQNRPTGTLTVVFDGRLLLPADDVFSAPIQRLRREGRKLCELVSLASLEQGISGAELMKHFCKLAFLVAHGLEGATDMLITVNPRHKIFYERIMLFTPLSGPVPCKKVNGAPAILLRLDIKNAISTYREKFKNLPASRNPHTFFLDRATDLVQWIKNNRSPMDQESMRRFFP